MVFELVEKHEGGCQCGSCRCLNWFVNKIERLEEEAYGVLPVSDRTDS